MAAVESVHPDEGASAFREPLPVSLGSLGRGAGIEPAIRRHQVGPVGAEPLEEPRLDARSQMQCSVDDGARSRLFDAHEGAVDRLERVGHVRHDRHEEHGHGKPGVGQCAHGVEPRLRGRGSGLDGLLQLVVVHRDRHLHVDGHALRGLHEQRDVAADQRALGEDRHRCAGCGERLDDAGHELVAPLGPLIRVGVGAEGHRLMLPAAAPQLLLEHLDHVHLDHDLRIEVRSAVEVEVLVRAAGEAVMADDAVGDEVARARRDVEQIPNPRQRGDVHDPKIRCCLHRRTDDIEFSCNGRIHRREELMTTRQASDHSNAAYAARARGLHDVGNAERIHTFFDQSDDVRVFVRYAQDPARAAALCIEHSTEEACEPGLVRRSRRDDEVFDFRYAGARCCVDRVCGAAGRALGSESPQSSRHTLGIEVFAGALQRLRIDQGQAEHVDLASSRRTRIGAMEDHSVARIMPARVTTPVGVTGVVDLIDGRPDAEAHQTIVRREMRSLSGLGVRDMLPSSLREEAVVATGDHRCAIGESQSKCGLLGRPLGANLRTHIASIPSDPLCPHDLIADLKVAQWSLPTVRAQDQSVGGDTVDACMRTSAVRVDRPGERHARSAGHVVQGRLRQHLVERHPGELGGGHRPQHARPVFESGQRRCIRLAELLSLPPHLNIRTKHRLDVNPEW